MFWAVLAGALGLCAIAAVYYSAAGLTLSHYDARAHLVVSRRVTDSLTPGWRQFGALWLPLPHVLNALPATWDWAYRSGAIAILLSATCFALGLAAIARTLTLRTGSAAAALGASALAATNPNVLYLLATPMTEPMLLGLALLSVACVDAWLQEPEVSRARLAGAVLVLLVLTRYEGWLVAVSLVGIALATAALRGHRLAPALWQPPLAAIGLFFAASWASTGQWLFSTGFFTPDPELLQQPRVVVDKTVTGFLDLGGSILALAGTMGVAALVVRAKRMPERVLFLSLLAPTVLPLVAFYSGHPFRVRYLIPLAFASAILSAFAVASLPRRARAVAAIALCAGVMWTQRPFDPASPMVVEAQWEVPRRLARQEVTRALLQRDDGTPVLASMGSLGHYMHETSQAGLPLKRFLHEGTGDLWLEAIKAPRRMVRWVLVEEHAEGGDELAARARQDPAFLAGFNRVIEAGGLVLYERIGK